MKKTETLKSLLAGIVQKAEPDGMLLSGGLDTALLASLLEGRKLHAVTVAVGDASTDLYFAEKLAKKFGWEHTVIRTRFEEILEQMPDTIRVLHSFDPMTLRNNVVIQMALKKAKSLGLKRVMTGDGGDEIFAGYRFIFEKKPRAMLHSLKRMWKIMHFSSQDLGKDLGIEILSPYLDEKIKSFAENLSAADLVTAREGGKIGKAILRYAFEDRLPPEFIWRVKSPIQDGSGSALITGYLEQAIRDREYEKEKERIFREDKVLIRDKEQFAYYRIYRKNLGKPQGAKKGEIACPACGTEVSPPEGKFCRTCGLWPAC